MNCIATLGSKRHQILFECFSETSKGSRVTEKMIFSSKTVRRDNHRENIKVPKVLIRLWHYLYEKIWFGRRYAPENE